MEEKQFRNKVIWFTFALSILVVWVHSFNAELFLEEAGMSARVMFWELMIGDVIAQIAVPGFFMLSSYLFYRNFSWDRLKGKWLSRTRSIVAPYLLWNLIYYIGYAVGPRIPFVMRVAGKDAAPLELKTLVEAVFLFSYNPVFWYLFELILLIVLAPALFMLLKNRWIGAAVLAAELFVVWKGWQLTWLNPDALFYYSAAGYAALHLRKLVEWEHEGQGGALTRSLAGTVILCAACACYMAALSCQSVFYLVLYRFLAPAALWFLVNSAWLGEARPWMRHNFFMYSVHFIIVRFVNKAGAMALPHTPATALTVYLLMPFVVVIISYGLSAVLKRLLPGFYAALSGGR